MSWQLVKWSNSLLEKVLFIKTGNNNTDFPDPQTRPSSLSLKPAPQTKPSKTGILKGPAPHD